MGIDCVIIHNHISKCFFDGVSSQSCGQKESSSRGSNTLVVLSPNHEQDAEVAMATAAKKKGELAVGAKGLPVQMPTNRPPCHGSHESCRKCRQLPPSPRPTHPPFPLPSVKHTHTHKPIHTYKEGRH